MSQFVLGQVFQQLFSCISSYVLHTHFFGYDSCPPGYLSPEDRIHFYLRVILHLMGSNVVRILERKAVGMAQGNELGMFRCNEVGKMGIQADNLGMCHS